MHDLVDDRWYDVYRNIMYKLPHGGPVSVMVTLYITPLSLSLLGEGATLAVGGLGEGATAVAGEGDGGGSVNTTCCLGHSMKLLTAWPSVSIPSGPGMSSILSSCPGTTVCTSTLQNASRMGTLWNSRPGIANPVATCFLRPIMP